MNTRRARLRPAAPRARRYVLLATTAACLLELFGPHQAVVADLAGLWLVLGAPTAVWYGCATALTTTADAAALLALGFALVADMLVLLGLNTLLPYLGDSRPLGAIPIAATLALTVIVLGAVLPSGEKGRVTAWRPSAGQSTGIGLAGLVCLALSVAGPIRLNNGFSNDVSTVAMVCATALAVLVLALPRLSAAATELGLYCAALSLLLVTSLRGWMITGHDVQKEYYYFTVASGWQHWDVHLFSNPFNACLSITLLPVALAKLTAISGVAVFKVVLPALFAAAPVTIFRAARNVAPRRIAVLSAVFFIMFPTYFTDMPYLGRQEVAFLLLGCAMLLVTEGKPRLRDRRIGFLVLMGGLALAHYSTTYVVILVLAMAVVVDLCRRLGASRRSRRAPARAARTGSARRRSIEPSFLAWWMIPVVAGLALLWAGPVTGTTGQLKSTVSIALREVMGKDAGDAASSGTSFSILGGSSETDQQRLADYKATVMANSAAQRAKGGLLPTSVTDAVSTPYVAPAGVPATSVGRALEKYGIDISGINTLGRTAVAYLLQLLIVLGLAALWLRRAKGLEPVRDQVSLTVGALGMLAMLTLIPQLSVDYSVLRAFQQGIFFFAPFMALGLCWAADVLKRWSTPAVCAVVAALTLFLTGALPRVTGAYAAPLSLGNTGQYYDIYYPTPAEVRAAAWLEHTIHTNGSPANSPGNIIQTDQYTYNRLQTLLTGDVKANIYPGVLSSDAYTFVGGETADLGEVTVFFRGNLVTYRYPTSLLDQVYDEIYASDGAVIYQ